MFWSPSRLIIEFSVRPRLRKMDRSYLTDDLSIISCRGDNLLWELRKNLVAGCWLLVAGCWLLVAGIN